MDKEGKEYFEKLEWKRIKKVDKAQQKIRNILDKYDCDLFEIIKVDHLDVQAKILKKLAKHLRFKIIPYKK